VGHLNLSAQVRAVDEIARVGLAGEKRHGAPKRQIHADAHLLVFEERHARGGTR